MLRSSKSPAMNPYFRPRRSMLYVPGCNARYLNKARTLRVDSVILDLGDPILVEMKVESRRLVVEAVLAGGYGRREVVVRVNDLDSPWGPEDVQAVARTGADALLFPNIESRADVENALKALDAAGGAHLPVMLLIESPIGVLRAEEISARELPPTSLREVAALSYEVPSLTKFSDMAQFLALDPPLPSLEP